MNSRFQTRRFQGWSAAVLAAACGLPLASASAQEPASSGMMRFPDVSRSHIAFVYANDIWIVPKGGGVAQPLASPPGGEVFPRFSPDGSTIAFGGNYDGNRDLYAVPVAGGQPFRITHHPTGETLSDWTPDGKELIFLASGMSGFTRQPQLWKVEADGGLPTKLPVPYGGFGSISPDGTWLAYTPHSTDNRTWKRYRGGMATDIWLFNLKDNTSRKITDWEGTDTLPMWAPNSSGVVYYLSDNGPEHRLNIWSFDVSSGQRRQITTFKDDDVRWPSMGPGDGGAGEIVFQLGARLMLLSLSDGSSREVKVQIPGARPKLRPRTVNASDNMGGYSVSPTGKRVAVEGRGDLWSVPVKEGVTRSLTMNDDVAERDPSWSPDGRWIAYFSDESGEYELWVRPSDARPPEEKKDAEKKDGEKKPEAKEGDAKPAGDEAKPEGEEAKPEAKPEPRKLTSLGAGYRYNPMWSPDSKRIAFTDAGGRVMVTLVGTGETKEMDKDPWMTIPTMSWSGDSRWLAYTRTDEGNRNSAVWIMNVETGEKTRVVSPMFDCTSVAFDRDGDFLFFASQRIIQNPQYSALDLSFIYENATMLYMVPLRNDVKNPWAPKSDEETYKKDEPKKDEKKEEPKKDDAKPADGKDADAAKDGAKPEAAAADDGVSGSWSGSASGVGESGATVPFQMTLTLAKDGTLTATMVSAMGGGQGTGTYDKATGAINLTVTVGEGAVSLTGTLKDGSIDGTWSVGEMSGKWSATRTAAGGGQDSKGGEKKDGDKKDEAKDKKKEVKIDFDRFESRAMALPISPGNLGGLSVADGAKLLYVRFGSGDSGIKIFDYKGDEPSEKDVVSGGGYDLSADGKKIVVRRGSALNLHDASAGGGKAQAVQTGAMRKTIRDPRAEWRQIFNEAWRLQRDFFYEPTMHGVDWPKMREHYGKMVEDAASREDLNWIIAEMISELNIGHAYLGNPGDVEGQPAVGVGVLGCDFEFVPGEGGGAYRISKIYTGGPWDSDARGPLSQPGVDVKEGDFLLAVNGVPIDTSRDPWAAFLGAAGQTVQLTVNASPTMDGKQREVIVKTLSGDTDLRYRWWIEKNRAYVEEKSGGKIGYVYVPNTGQDGQNDLFRQFYGQIGSQAMIIDERWNGGGQIPTRFIELLNRPRTNYWARRDGKDWGWPPDSHQGPKAMLVNGLAGSGGDMFPWLFKHNKIGKVIGTRTWGGLVGISGNPQFVDGGTITVPTFGFYETDGTWGVEGHGTDPDIVVVDDPALMVNGGDPQLDAAIAHLLEEIQKNGYTPPARPKSPDRKGMGIAEQDK